MLDTLGSTVPDIKVSIVKLAYKKTAFGPCIHFPDKLLPVLGEYVCCDGTLKSGLVIRCNVKNMPGPQHIIKVDKGSARAQLGDYALGASVDRPWQPFPVVVESMQIDGSTVLTFKPVDLAVPKAGFVNKPVFGTVSTIKTETITSNKNTQDVDVDCLISVVIGTKDIEVVSLVLPPTARDIFGSVVLLHGDLLHGLKLTKPGLDQEPGMCLLWKSTEGRWRINVGADWFGFETKAGLRRQRPVKGHIFYEGQNPVLMLDPIDVRTIEARPRRQTKAYLEKRSQVVDAPQEPAPTPEAKPDEELQQIMLALTVLRPAGHHMKQAVVKLLALCPKNDVVLELEGNEIKARQVKPIDLLY